MLKKLHEFIDNQRDRVIELQEKLVSIPAVGPKNGGDGEKEKADWLKAEMSRMGIGPIQEFNAPDPDVSCGYRPNIAAVIKGRDTSRTLWIMGHTDVVPAGDMSLWHSDPFTLKVDGDQLIGRGVEDDHMGIVPPLLVAQALIETGTVPDINLGLLFVADEETGSDLGLGHVVDNHMEIFGPHDLILVPDFGAPDSELVEVAEKTMLQMKLTVLGKQCHASTPEQGTNTMPACADLILRAHGLYDKFPARNALFEPCTSTFEPTKREANVGNVNTIPGKDVFYVDCRLLPELPHTEVMEAMRGEADEVEKKWGVSVELDIDHLDESAPPTDPESEIVKRLIRRIREVYDNDPKPVGIGGGTVAARFRKKNIPAAVWGTCSPSFHQPNEHASIKSMIGDAKVMAGLLFDE